MESIHVEELKLIVVAVKETVNQSLDQIIKAIDTKILVGNIHVPAEKKPRKKRTRKQKIQDFSAPTSPTPKKDLPDADEGKAGEFFKKKREKKIDGGE